MAIINRDLDASQQTVLVSSTLCKTDTGVTYSVLIVPYPAQLMAVQSTGVGSSGSPTCSLWLQRFVVGSGVTTNQIGASWAVTTYGTSAAVSVTVINGASQLLQAGDVLMVNQAGSAASAAQLNVTMVIKALQDIKSTF